MDRSSISYRNAFAAYLRWGTPLWLSLKQSHPTTHYIWRTRGDDRVREPHARNDRKVFAWADPPPTGHPGEDHGCRCIAESFYGDTREKMDQVLSIGPSSGRRWDNFDFVSHFYAGKTVGVSLSQIGHLSDAARHWTYRLGRIHKWNDCIAWKARTVEDGRFEHNFNNTYDFGKVAYSHGSSTVIGTFSGSKRTLGDVLHIRGKTTYTFSDRFTDPGSVRSFLKKLRESPDRAARLSQTVGAEVSRFFGSDLIGDPTGDPYKAELDDVYDWFLYATEVGGSAYNITGSWTSELTAVILKDETRSRYRDNDGECSTP